LGEELDAKIMDASDEQQVQPAEFAKETPAAKITHLSIAAASKMK
jgi:hypothetical protein